MADLPNDSHEFDATGQARNRGEQIFTTSDHPYARSVTLSAEVLLDRPHPWTHFIIRNREDGQMITWAAIDLKEVAALHEALGMLLITSR